MPKIENKLFDEICIGDTSTFTKTLKESDLMLFAAVSGDTNPLHLDEEYAKTSSFGERIAHGMWTGSLISAAIANKLPGPGSVYLGQSFTFKRPVKIGDTIEVTLEIKEKITKRKRLLIACKASNQHKQIVLTGEANVMAPETKIIVEQPILPSFTMK